LGTLGDALYLIKLNYAVTAFSLRKGKVPSKSFVYQKIEKEGETSLLIV